MNPDLQRPGFDEGSDRPVDGLDALARRRSPARDLWPGIEARLAPRRSRYAGLQFALAASVTAGLAAVLALGLRDAPPAATGLAAAPLPLTADARAIVEANADLVRDAERQLRRALEQDPDSTTLRSLLERVEKRQRTLRAML